MGRQLISVSWLRKQSILVIIGMSFFWQLFRRTTLQSILPLQMPSCFIFNDIPVSAAVLFYTTALLFGITLLISSGFRRVAISAPSVLGSSLASSIFSCLFVMLEGSGAFVDDGKFLIGWFAIFSTSFAFVSLTVSWILLCCQIASRNPGQLVCVLCLSVIASFALSLAFYLVAPTLKILMMIAPACSAVLLLLSSKSAFVFTVHQDSSLNWSRPSFLFPRGVVSALVILLVFVTGIKEVSDLLYVSATGPMQFIKYLVTVIEIIAIMMICLLVSDVSRFAFLGWAVLAGGVASAFAALLLFPENTVMFHLGLGVIPAAKTCLELFICVVITQAKRDGATLAILLLVVPESVSYLAGAMVLPALLSSLQVPGESWLGMLSFGAGVIVLVSTFLVMGSLAFKGLGSDSGNCSSLGSSLCESISESGVDELRFDALTETYVLTKRERETAYLFFRGYSTKRIAELHYVSLNTTQSHLRSVYRKMSIHCRQDLIDRVEYLESLRSAPPRSGE